MKKNNSYQRSRIRRRVRGKISGTAARPRLSVFRSNKQIYTQIIDDEAGKTLASASSQDESISSKTVTKIEQAKLVGMLLAEKAKEANVEAVIFDRSGYVYHGRIKSMADGAREGGLKF
ncbi:MAG: 50S ribosomal protein L18 [Bacteroidales bacterium]|nr:50S ribosomal protein L18 [Bacteroidales bacterium]